MRVLGIDPGYGIVGWAVIEQNLDIIAFDAIETPSALPIEDRLLLIHTELLEIIQNYHPACAALEKLFFTKNTKTAMDVARSIGVILLTLKLSSVKYQEYTPPQVKQALTGYGRAGKGQMTTVVTRIFNLKETPRKDDIADALAIAACHSFSLVPRRIQFFEN